jgi:flagellar hook protein FlgE
LLSLGAEFAGKINNTNHSQQECTMISALQSALSGLQSFGVKIQCNSNNIANINSDGFKKSRVTMANMEPQGVKAQVDKVSTPGPTVLQEIGSGHEMVELSNVDMGEEIVNMNLNSTMYKANLKSIETINEMTGELLKIKS